MESTPLDAISPPANVLLLHDSQAQLPDCESLCCGADRTAILRVSFGGESCEEPPLGATDARVGVLSVGDVIRAGESSDEPDFSGPVAVDTVADPTDLSAIGVSISRFCEHWADEQVGVCFSSLDALLRQRDPEPIFEFIYYLNRRLETVDAMAHFHLDTSRHEDRIVAAFGEIFDEIVIDDSATGSIPEATDDDVASLLADIEAEPDSPTYPWETGQISEATDEDVEQVLGG
ncbi:hypothetical protein Halru_2637 [Halovivax ruber XH-70]|uniref:Uncharacterized protein n=1 Tax=Halovivax ruber (strain DSM 18193 / JCM 13892 / XH-70) TaxID=797302 RepID=L0IEL8_HALRX|nr:hypothetical protein [Halovivax ruber]AGB17214.1 hypothetical protein Halru_2637 [Halovivax ruber XH-70]